MGVLFVTINPICPSQFALAQVARCNGSPERRGSPNCHRSKWLAIIVFYRGKVLELNEISYQLLNYVFQFVTEKPRPVMAIRQLLVSV